MTTAIKSVSLSLELAHLADTKKLSLSEAVRIGLAVMLYEMGEPTFFNKLNISREIGMLQQNIGKLQTKLTEVINKDVVVEEK